MQKNESDPFTIYISSGTVHEVIGLLITLPTGLAIRQSSPKVIEYTNKYLLLLTRRIIGEAFMLGFSESKNSFRLFTFFLLISIAGFGFAEVTFEWVEVGNPDNVADPLNEGTVAGIGVVNRNYRIARHLVTNDQYAEFLNAVGASDTGSLGQIWIQEMGSDARGGITRSGSNGSYTYAVKTNMGDKPVNLVSFFSAMRFINWLHNGQPAGEQDASTTEDGVYTISDGLSETRNSGARYFLPDENEWYKAAFHQPAAEGGDADDYWLYSTASNITPTMAAANATGDISNPGANVANYGQGADWNGLDGNVTTVGSAGASSYSYYGTADQSGNVLEWTETLFQQDPDPGCMSPPCFRLVRGGSWDNPESLMQSTFRSTFGVQFGDQRLGFRVAAPPVFIINPGLNDAWVNEDAPFQGMFITVFQDLGIVFLAWFTFDSEIPSMGEMATFGAADHRWVTAIGFIEGDTVVLNAELTTGGIFNASDPQATQDSNYGIITIVFLGCNEAQVHYEFPGPNISGDMIIKRVLEDNAALCEALN